MLENGVASLRWGFRGTGVCKQRGRACDLSKLLSTGAIHVYCNVYVTQHRQGVLMKLDGLQILYRQHLNKFGIVILRQGEWETYMRKRFAAMLGNAADYPLLIDDSLRCIHASAAFFCQSTLNTADLPPHSWTEGNIIANLREAHVRNRLAVGWFDKSDVMRHSDVHCVS